MFTVALTMSEDKIKCPICGTANDEGSENCTMCKTLLSKKKDGSLKVASPKSSGQTFNMIDIEDPITRKKLEELTLIPGVNRKKALLLYRSGIHSMEEFLQKAFHGERYSDNYARTVSNKLLMQSLKGQEEEQELLCPSCQAPNPMGASKCKVCNFEIEKEMAAIDLGNVSESVTGILDELDDDADFDALPDELKAQFASVIDSDDIDYDMEAPEDLDSLGIDLDKIDEEATSTDEDSVEEISAEKESEEAAEETGVETVDEATGEMPDEPVPEEIAPEESENLDEEETISEESEQDEVPDEEIVEVEEPETESQPVEEVAVPEKDSAQEPTPEPPVKEDEEETISEEPEIEPEPEKKLTAKEEKIRKVLSGKVEQWRKAGYDTDGLDQYYIDVETFKVKAKEVLEKGKVIQKKYEKQMEMWREKGFDVSELEPLLKSDLDAFQDRAKEVLKKQKK